MNKVFYFSISLTSDEVLAIYRGVIRRIMVITDSGLRLEISANHFKSFTTREGIKGRFKLVLSETNAFVSISKV
ncbi:MAG: DUF2835 family protein [Succinivibrionaceae bacterium]